MVSVVFVGPVVIVGRPNPDSVEVFLLVLNLDSAPFRQPVHAAFGFRLFERLLFDLFNRPDLRPVTRNQSFRVSDFPVQLLDVFVHGVKVSVVRVNVNSGNYGIELP